MAEAGDGVGSGRCNISDQIIIINSCAREGLRLRIIDSYLSGSCAVLGTIHILRRT